MVAKGTVKPVFEFCKGQSLDCQTCCGEYVDETREIGNSFTVESWTCVENPEGISNTRLGFQRALNVCSGSVAERRDFLKSLPI
jgi:hypothetical protein